MKDEIITLETAKLAHAKGCPMIIKQCSPNPTEACVFHLITQALLQRWLREKRNVMLSVYNNASGYLWNKADTVGGTDRGWSEYTGPNDSGVWDTHEGALEDGLQKSLLELP